jgi:hypothetical protein
MLATYVYNHCNICNIPLYLCNIRMKHSQHTSKTIETFKFYTCNIHCIPVWPPPPSASGRRRAAAVAGGKARGLPRQGPALLLALSALSVGAGSGARAAGRHVQNRSRSSIRSDEAGAWKRYRSSTAERWSRSRGARGVGVGNATADVADANGETLPTGSKEESRTFFFKQPIGGGIQVS